MTPLVLGAIGLGTAIVTYKIVSPKVTVPAPGTALDPGMDALTAAVVKKAIETETDSAILDHLALVLSAAGFASSAASVSARSKAVKGAIATTGSFSVGGLFEDIGQLLGISSDPMDARELQSDLNQLGYGPLAVDGIVGPKTIAAIQRFQTRAGIPLTTHANVETVSAIRYALTNTASALLAPANPHPYVELG